MTNVKTTIKPATDKEIVESWKQCAKDLKAEKKETNKGVSFCFTDFKEENIKKGYKTVFKEYNDMIRGIAWGVETCPKTGKKHNQGFIQLYKQNRYSAIKKWINSKAHFEVLRGSIKDNKEYCSKEGKYTKLGMFVSRGYRSDLHNIKDDLMNGASLYDVMDKYTGDFVRYSSGIIKMKSLIDKKKGLNWRNVDVKVLYGQAGTGKTSYVMKKHGYENVFTLDSKWSSTSFWGDYDGEDVLLIDDFNGWIQYSYLLRVLDGHPLQLNIKGGSTYARWTKVYITSNAMGHQWYKNISKNLTRRVGECLEVTKGNTEPFVLEKFWEPDEMDVCEDVYGGEVSVW